MKYRYMLARFAIAAVVAFCGMSPRATLVAVHELAIIDLSAMHCGTMDEQFVVISDATNSMSLVSPQRKLLRVMALPGREPGGVRPDDEGHLYIAQDSGGIIKLTRQRNREEIE